LNPHHSSPERQQAVACSGVRHAQPLYDSFTPAGGARSYAEGEFSRAAQYFLVRVRTFSLNPHHSSPERQQVVACSGVQHAQPLYDSFTPAGGVCSYAEGEFARAAQYFLVWVRTFSLNPSGRPGRESI